MICAAVTVTVCPWLADTVPLMSAVAGLGLAGLAFLLPPQAMSLIVITQPASNASAASNVNSRRVTAVDSLTDCMSSDMNTSGRDLLPARAWPMAFRSGFARLTSDFSRYHGVLASGRLS